MSHADPRGECVQYLGWTGHCTGGRSVPAPTGPATLICPKGLDEFDTPGLVLSLKSVKQERAILVY